MSYAKSIPRPWPDLPRAYGAPRGRGAIRARVEDFRVSETLSFKPAGVGEHWLVKVRKRCANTHWVGGQLARYAGVSPGKVGYAGLKDRHAVAEQWFSVHTGVHADPAWHALRHPEFTVLDAHRHNRKLRQGTVCSNRFCITVRQLQADRAEFETLLRTVAAHGVPNYFGPQRFGRDGNNIHSAIELMSHGRLPQNRYKRGLLFSTARSLLFNELLGERAGNGSWHQCLPGELLMLDGSHSIFGVEMPDETVAERLAILDCHPSGPLWGAGGSPATGRVAELESEIAARFPIISNGLEQAGLKHSRRALRVRVSQLYWRWVEKDSLRIEFALPSGSYATSILRELLDFDDLSQQEGSSDAG